MIGLLAIGFILGATAVILIAEWQRFHDWVKRCLEKVKQVVRNALQGVKVFIQKITSGKAFQKSYHYSKNNIGKWEETITRKEISAEDVPPEIREKFAIASTSQNIDITEQYKEVLSKTA